MFVFFKQRTAYELRSRDWSADVCSSELGKLTMKSYLKAALPLSFAALLLAGCSSGEPAPETAENVTTAEKASHAEEEGVIDLSPEQIRKAGIALVRVVRSGRGAWTFAATIEGQPHGAANQQAVG